MEKKIGLIGIVALVAIIVMVFVVNTTLSGMLINADDYYVRPSGMQWRVESGVSILQSEPVINQVCRNTIPCGNTRITYTCCKHDGSGCILPSAADQSRGSCPLSYRSRCQCREDYVAGLIEKYG